MSYLFLPRFRLHFILTFHQYIPLLPFLRLSLQPMCLVCHPSFCLDTHRCFAQPDGENIRNELLIFHEVDDSAVDLQRKRGKEGPQGEAGGKRGPNEIRIDLA